MLDKHFTYFPSSKRLLHTNTLPFYLSMLVTNIFDLSGCGARSSNLTEIDPISLCDRVFDQTCVRPVKLNSGANFQSQPYIYLTHLNTNFCRPSRIYSQIYSNHSPSILTHSISSILHRSTPNSSLRLPSLQTRP